MRRLGSGLAMMSLVSLLGVTPSFAAVCDSTTKQHIFAHDVGSGSPSALYSFSGVAVTTLLRDETLDPNCIDIDGRWTTAHISGPDSIGDLVEIGWFTNWRSSPPASRRFGIFYEVAEGFVVTERNTTVVSQPATLSRFKVERNPSLVDYWKFFYDLENDGTYLQMGNVIQGHKATFSFGWAKGETGRRAASSAYDDLSNLWSRRNPGVWMPWTNVIRDYDTIPSYHCHRVSARRYQVHSPNTEHSCT